MNIISALILITAGIVQAAGATIVKYATVYKNTDNSNTLKFYVLMGIAGLLFGGGFPIYTYGVSRVKLSLAQPVFSSTIFLSVTILSYIIFKESLSAHQLAGIAVIIAGIVVVIT